MTEYYEVVGYSEVNLRENSTYESSEWNIGDVITDSMVDIWNGSVNFAFINNGGIRSSIRSGEITGEDVYSVLPFENTVDMVKCILFFCLK